MYAAGRIPDHVTRYNHKNLNRWMIHTAELVQVAAMCEKLVRTVTG